MSLQALLSMQDIGGIQKERALITENRLENQLPNLRKRIAFWREYPDLFIDENKGTKSTFKFYTYQRVFLRIIMRHKYVYATFPRAYENAPIKILKIFDKLL